MKTDKWKIFITLLKWLVAGIFISAGVSKILNPAQFAVDIDNYRILPYLLVTVLAVVLPWLEVICGASLIFKIKQRGALLTLLMLSFVFLIAIASAVVRGLDITCGCFSFDAEGTRVGYLRLIEDALLLVSITFLNFQKIKNSADGY